MYMEEVDREFNNLAKKWEVPIQVALLPIQ